MSPIENVAPNIVEVTTEENVQLRHKPDRSRDLFGVQLEVTSLLLEAERRKLSVLQRELQIALDEGGSIKAKEHQKQELLVAIARIQAQHDLLDKEYREHALGALLSANTRGFGKRCTERQEEQDRLQEFLQEQEKTELEKYKGNMTGIGIPHEHYEQYEQYLSQTLLKEQENNKADEKPKGQGLLVKVPEEQMEKGWRRREEVRLQKILEKQE